MPHCRDNFFYVLMSNSLDTGSKGLEGCVKVALTLGYIGTGYKGSLFNPHLPTVEGDLRQALKSIGASSWGKSVKEKYQWSAMSR